MSWPTVALREVADIERNSVKPENIASGTRYLGLEHVEIGGRIISSETVENGELASSKFSFGPRHILYGKLRPYLAKIALPDFEGVCSTDILPVLPSERVEKNYLAHFLRQSNMVDYANSLSTGANLPRLNPNALAEFPIPLPPLEEQKRIAGILDQADALRRLRTRALEKLNTLGQAIFHEMFIQGKQVSGALTDILTETQIGPFGSLLHKSDYVSGGTCLINPMHINGGQIQPDPNFSISDEKLSELQRYVLRTGDIIMGRRGEMGRCAVISESDPCLICGTGSMVLRVNQTKTTPEFLAFFLSTDAARRQLENVASGVTMPNLNTKSLGAVKVPLPTFKEQEEFSALKKGIEDQIKQARNLLSSQEALFASLQHRAFRGEL